jgi:hypothetical protein
MVLNNSFEEDNDKRVETMPTILSQGIPEILSETNIGIQKACYALKRLTGHTDLHRDLP